MRKSKIAEEWRDEGRVEGLVEAKRSNLLRVLELRFPTQISDDLTTAVEAMTDLDELSRWFDIAVTTPSFDAFLPG